MDRIPKFDGESKRVQVIRGGLGYVLKGQQEHWHGVMLPKRSRGDITTFSSASARRLRETLALAHYKGGDATVWGITYTIPGKVLTPSQVRRLWHDWVREYQRHFPKYPMVWRIELQKRKQAHWHCVHWFPRESGILNAFMVSNKYREVVRRHVGVLEERTDRGFELHGVELRPLDGATATGLIGYLCDHASKHKRDQLGWQGRQWGVVNRAALDFGGELVVDVSQEVHKQAARQFRRLQEHLRRDGIYTGGAVTPSGAVMRSVFGRDADRLLKCYQVAAATCQINAPSSSH